MLVGVWADGEAGSEVRIEACTDTSLSAAHQRTAKYILCDRCARRDSASFTGADRDLGLSLALIGAKLWFVRELKSTNYRLHIVIQCYLEKTGLLRSPPL